MSVSALMVSPLWKSAGWTILHLLWVNGLLGMAAALGRLWLRGARPDVRYACALAFFLALAIAPAGVFYHVYEPAPSIEQVERTPDLLTAPRPLNDSTSPGASPGKSVFGGSKSSSPRLRPQIATEHQGKLRSWLDVLAVSLPWIWLFGSPLTFGLLATGLVGAERLRGGCRHLSVGPVPFLCDRLANSLGLARVAVAVSDCLATPVLVGVIRPLILLPPAALTGWSVQQLEMVLLHELAHVRRCDNLVNLFQRVVESLLFFHPVVWWVSAWVRLEREHCCDDVVVVQTAQPRAYAEALAALGGVGVLKISRFGGVAMAEGELVKRVREVLKREERSMRLPKSIIGGAAALILTPMFLLVSYAQQNQPKPGRARAPSTVVEDNTPRFNTKAQPIAQMTELLAYNKSPNQQEEPKPANELNPGKFLRGFSLPSDSQAIVLDRSGELLVGGGGRLKDPVRIDKQKAIDVRKARARGLPSKQLDEEQNAWKNGETVGELRLISTRSGDDLRVFEGSFGVVFSVALSPDKKLVAAAGRTGGPVENGPKGGEVKLWEVATKRLRATLVGHTNWVGAVAFSPDGKLLATGGLDHTVKVWDVASGKEVTTLPRQTQDVGRVAFSPDGRLLFAAMRYGGGVKLWNTRDWTEQAELGDRADYWFDAVFSPDGKTLALSGGRRVGKDYDVGQVKLWNPATGEVRTLFNQSKYVYSASFSPDGRRLAAVVNDLTVVVWDLVEKNEITRIKRQICSSADQVFFLPTGNELLVTSIALRRVEIWKISH